MPFNANLIWHYSSSIKYVEKTDTRKTCLLIISIIEKYVLRLKIIYLNNKWSNLPMKNGFPKTSENVYHTSCTLKQTSKITMFLIK